MLKSILLLLMTAVTATAFHRRCSSPKINLPTKVSKDIFEYRKILSEIQQAEELKSKIENITEELKSDINTQLTNCTANNTCEDERFSCVTILGENKCLRKSKFGAACLLSCPNGTSDAFVSQCADNYFCNVKKSVIEDPTTGLLYGICDEKKSTRVQNVWKNRFCGKVYIGGNVHFYNRVRCNKCMKYGGNVTFKGSTSTQMNGRVKRSYRGNWRVSKFSRRNRNRASKFNRRNRLVFKFNCKKTSFPGDVNFYSAVSFNEDVFIRGDVTYHSSSDGCQNPCPPENPNHYFEISSSPKFIDLNTVPYCNKESVCPANMTCIQHCRKFKCVPVNVEDGVCKLIRCTNSTTQDGGCPDGLKCSRDRVLVSHDYKDVYGRCQKNPKTFLNVNDVEAKVCRRSTYRHSAWRRFY